MGSAPSEIHKYLLLLDLLKSQHVPFVNTHTVVIQRGSSGKLGIKLKVQNIGESDTFCIVTEVKPVCRLVSGSHLTQFECVVSINGNDVRGLTEDQVFGLIDSIQDYTITLVVCDVLKNNKRTRSQLSNSSELSNSMEVRKKISGMRRMIKSNSVENDEKESSEHDSLLAGEQRVGSQVDQHFNTASCYEERVCSVPVMTERHPVEEEHYHSMPVGSGVCKECKNNNCTGHNHVNLTNKGGNSWAKSVGFVGSYEDLFKYPHRVKWDCLTKAVDLKTSSQGKFGFSYKVKEFKNNADDWYTLVTSVTEDGPADGKLMVGDWIRSIDGHALANPKEALFLEKKLERLREVKVVFQRPEGMLPRHKSFQTGHRPDIVEPNPPHSPISAPTMLTDITGQPVKSNVPLPGSCSPVNAKVGGRSDGYIRQPSTMSKSSVSSTFSSGSCEPRQVKPKQSPSTLDPSSRFTIRPISPGAKVEHVQIFVPGLQSADGTSGGLDDFQMKVKFPKVRIFICGTNARQLSQLLLPNFLLPTDNTVRLFDRVFATMAMERSGEVGFEPWSQYDRLLQIDERARHASNDSLNQCDTSDRSYPSSVGCGAINTEIFIVYDEKFFLQCCQYLFTRTSVFLLSFDGDKMLKSPPCEIHRLQNTIHTIRGAVGYECPIQTYGLLGVDSSDIASTATIDEVRTLFYTSHGNQIVKYNVPRHPHLFHMANGARPNVEVQTSVWRFISEIQEKQYILLISMAMIHQLEQRRQNDVACIDEDDFTATFQETVPGADLGIRQVVWTELLEFGEILSTKAALLPVSSISQLDKLLFIRPDILLDRIHQLQTISPRIIQSNEAIKQIWLKLIASGFFLQSDWSEICPQTDLYSMSSMKLQLSPDKVLLLLQAFGLIFRQEAIDGSHYFIPCFIPEPVYSEKTFEYTTGSLYFQLRGNPPHISSMIYFHLVFRLNNASDARSLVVTNSITCVIHHAGYEITLIHEKLRDRIQIQLNRLEKNVRLHAVLDWLTEICKSSLGSEVKYVLGPACPLQEKCSYAQHTRKNSEELHVLDLAEGLPIFCGNIKVDNQVKVWLKPSKKQQSGRHELLPHQDTETGSNESFKSFETPGPAPLYIKSLPYHVFRDVYENLQINVQKDWRCLAGLLGFTVEEILVYETKSEPAKMLLLDLDQTQRMTVKQLVDVLAKPEMQRQDIIEKLSKFLNGV